MIPIYRNMGLENSVLYEFVRFLWVYSAPHPSTPPSSSLPTSAATVSFNAEEETVKLEFPSDLATGEATLLLEYTGTLNDQMRGFYRSKYTDPSGKEKYAATTQFEVLHLCSVHMKTFMVGPDKSTIPGELF